MNNNELYYPVKMIPYSKSAIWGGTRLIEKYHKPAGLENYAEAWELSCRDGKMSIAANGPLAGKTLGEIIEILGNKSVSPEYDGGRFPLLVKFIDSASALSVQVHPSDAYALEHENDLGKTEMWYIMDADEGSELVIGMNEYDKTKLRTAAESGTLELLLHHIKVKPGETYFIPAGLVHAIGGGITLCEIQQNSDVTYRLYDYNRRGSDGKLRELHLDRALDVIRRFGDSNAERGAYEKLDYGHPVSDGEVLAACDKFTVIRYTVNGVQSVRVGDDSFASLSFTRGSGELHYKNMVEPVSAGDTFFVPAGAGEFSLHGVLEVLAASVPCAHK